jgi:hypothetical protein
MILWTIQPVEWYEDLQRNGYVYCKEKLSENLEDEPFVNAYNWLIKEMYKRGINNPNPCLIKYPLWAWHTYDWKHKKPDLRNSGFDRRGRKCVCLEIDIPDNQVLLSDYNAWHGVLNRWYLDDSNNEEEWEEIQNRFDKLPCAKRNKLMENSWQKVFDITPYESDWKSRGGYVQATFWFLRIDQVRKVQYFTTR